MKRLMMLIVMMAFILLLPMNVEAATIDGDFTVEQEEVYCLTEDTVITGDLYVYSELDLNGYDLHVQGDLFAKYDNILENIKIISIGANSLIVDGDAVIDGSQTTQTKIVIGSGTFAVGGNCEQNRSYISITSGTVKISGNLYTHTAGDVTFSGGINAYDAADITIGGSWEITGSSRCFFLIGDKGSITVEEDMIISTKSTGSTGYIDQSPKNSGNVYVKGDVIRGDEYKGNKMSLGTIILIGDSLQTYDVASDASCSLYLENPNVMINNYFNGSLNGDTSKLKFKDNTLCTIDFSFSGDKLVVPGNFTCWGTLTVSKGRLEIGGDCTIKAKAYHYSWIYGALNVKENGILDVKGKLILYATSGSYIELNVDETGTVIVEEDFITDTSELANVSLAAKKYRINSEGVIKVARDVNILTASEYFNISYLYLGGNRQQNVILTGDSPLIDTIELGYETKYYTFNPNPCWNTLIQLEGLVCTDEGFKYFENGAWISNAYKYVTYGGSKFLVAHGVLAAGMNGIAMDPLNPQDWYFLSGGQVQAQHTGLAEYDGQWFYVQKGKLDTTMNGCIEYDGALFMLAEGRIISETSGLVMDPNTGEWYYLANGQVQVQHTGLAEYDGEWFYVKAGKLDKVFKGCIEYDGVVFQVENGEIIGEGHISENGKCTHCGKITSAHGS